MMTHTDNTAEILNVPDSQEKNLEWYIANQKDLSAKFNGKVLLIVDQKLIKVFNDIGSAYDEATTQYNPGTFSLQPCSPDPESYTMMLYSPQYIIFA